MNEETTKNTGTAEAETAPETQPEETAKSSSDGSGRLFTQEEVNGIIKERLQRQRSKADEEHARQLSTQAADIAARESRLACKEFLLDSGYPQQLLDILDTSDPETFKSKAEEAVNAFKPQRNNSGISHRSSSERNEHFGNTAVADAFKNSKHKPKDAFYR